MSEVNKRDICKRCGGKRDPALGNRMCRPCYNAYMAEIRAGAFEDAPSGPPAPAPIEEQGCWEARLSAFERVYDRHGLKANEVWKLVKGVRREVSA